MKMNRDRRRAEMAAPGIHLDPQMVEAIARRVVELLGGGVQNEESARLVDASAVARELGVERDWVYAHAKDLGAVRLGGPQGRLRFDLQTIRERLGQGGATPWRPAKRPPRRHAPSRRQKGGGSTGRQVRLAHQKAAGRRVTADPTEQHEHREVTPMIATQRYPALQLRGV